MLFPQNIQHASAILVTRLHVSYFILRQASNWYECKYKELVALMVSTETYRTECLCTTNDGTEFKVFIFTYKCLCIRWIYMMMNEIVIKVTVCCIDIMCLWWLFYESELVFIEREVMFFFLDNRNIFLNDNNKCNFLNLQKTINTNASSQLNQIFKKCVLNINFCVCTCFIYLLLS